jgi:hypothetical protein
VDKYVAWAKTSLEEKKNNENVIQDTCTWIVSACKDTVVLMGKGVDAYVEWSANNIIDLAKLNKPIYPLLNEEWKSDAWLLGLVWAKLQKQNVKLNQKGVGFALAGKQAGVLKPAQKAVLTDTNWIALILDDASYSGTQAWTLLQNAKACNAFKWPPFAVAVVLAGISQTAEQKLKEIKGIKLSVQPMDKMPAGKIDKEVVKAIRSLEGYSGHIELDPANLAPKPTKGEFPPFVDISYAILPYKIPDSISVPTHLYCAYKSNVAKHLFSSDGSVDYRTVMPKGVLTFAKGI